MVLGQKLKTSPSGGEGVGQEKAMQDIGRIGHVPQYPGVNESGTSGID